MKRAIITGLAGQTGSYLAEQLIEAGYEVHAFERSPHPQEISEVISHTLDLRNSGQLVSQIEEIAPDAIFNLAAISSVAQSWSAPVETVETNALATVVMLEVASKIASPEKPISFIQASTAEIFGNSIQSPQNEDTAFRPVNPYGSSKLLAHQFVQFMRSTTLKASNCILYNHESPRRPLNFVTRKITHGVARIALGMSDSLTLGNLDAVRDWGWAPDYADALFRIMNKSEGGDYVVATGIGHSVADFVATAFLTVGISDWDKYVKQDPAFMRPSDIGVSIGDSAKIKRELGWSPTINFQGVVERMVNADMALLRTS